MIDEGRDGSVSSCPFLAAFTAELDRGCCDEVTEDKEDSEEEDWETSDNDEGVLVPSSGLKREYSPEEKEAEAVAIGYKVVGPLEKSDQVFKLYEPVFTIVQVQYDIFGLVFW